MFKLLFFSQKMKKYFVFISLKTTLDTFNNDNAGLPVWIYSHSFCIFYPEPFLFSAPTLYIIEWKSSCKEFLFVQLFFKSDNISLTTFREHAWVNGITKNCGAYREISPLIPKLFVYSHMTNGSLLSGKTELGKGIEERHFRRKRMDREFWRFDSSPVDLKLCNIRIISVKFLNCLIWLKEISRIRGKFQKCYLPNISGSKTRLSFPSSNFWNAFAEKVIFCMNDLMFLLQLQLYNIFTNVLFIISKSFH